MQAPPPYTFPPFFFHIDLQIHPQSKYGIANGRLMIIMYNQNIHNINGLPIKIDMNAKIEVIIPV